MTSSERKRLCLRALEAAVRGEPDAAVSRVLARWHGHEIVVQRDGKWLLDGLIMGFRRERELLHAVDPSVSPDLPPHLLDPVQIAYLLGIPSEEVDWPGIGTRADAAVLQALSGIDNRLAQVVEYVSRPMSAGSPRGGACCPPAPSGEEWLTLRQCADLSGRSITTIRRAVRDGVLKAHNVGRGRRKRSYRIHADDLHRYVEAGRVELPGPPHVPTTPVRTKSRHFG